LFHQANLCKCRTHTTRNHHVFARKCSQGHGSKIRCHYDPDRRFLRKVSEWRISAADPASRGRLGPKAPVAAFNGQGACLGSSVSARGKLEGEKRALNFSNPEAAAGELVQLAEAV
jgi:hypothetical protein